MPLIEYYNDMNDDQKAEFCKKTFIIGRLSKRRMGFMKLQKIYMGIEFKKYRMIQDRLFISDYDRYLLELYGKMKKSKEGF